MPEPSAALDATFERDSIPSDTYRLELTTMLAVHALPVWGWGQRTVYEDLLMSGPNLTQYVRTANLWAEQERALWQWEQLMQGLNARHDTIVAEVCGGLPGELVGAVHDWLDLMLLAALIDGIGEHMARTLERSSYGPLRRLAPQVLRNKRGQSSEGWTALREFSGEGPSQAREVRSRGVQWLDRAGALLHAAGQLETKSAWMPHSIASPLGVTGVIDRAVTRLEHLGRE